MVMIMFTQKIQEKERTQRRFFFRVDCDIPLKFTLVQKADVAPLLSNNKFEGTVCNLSGGGLKLMTDLDMEINDRIVTSLRLGGENLFLMGEVRVKYGYSPAMHQYEYGLMFIGISQLEQDKIIKYLLRQQTSLK